MNMYDLYFYKYTCNLNIVIYWRMVNRGFEEDGSAQLWNTMLVLPDIGETLWVTLTLKEMTAIKKKRILSNWLYVLV